MRFTQLLEQTESFGEIADEHELVVRLGGHLLQESVAEHQRRSSTEREDVPRKNRHFPTQSRIDTSSTISRIVAFGEQRLASWKLLREIDEVGMIAELSEERDRLERLRILSSQNRFAGVGGDEEAVEVQLEGRESTKDDVFVLDRDCSTASARFAEERRKTDDIS